MNILYLILGTAAHSAADIPASNLIPSLSYTAKSLVISYDLVLEVDQAVKYRAKLSQGNGELCSKIEPLSVCYKLLRFITQRSPTWMLCM
ncbi:MULTISPECIES: hypothetical protein, partial [unclassified Neisseria]|uniref:hypothetical protein n=1 Tax=unclassified Neisseria TaxID=2623750 RepID=UPI001ADDABE1